MKKFSKVLMIVMAVMLCVAFAGCAAPAPKDEPASEPDAEAGSAVAGSTWVVTSVKTSDGTEVTGEDVAAIFGGELSYTFNEDGTGIASVGETESELTYTESEGIVTVTATGATAEFTVDGDTMTTENESGVLTLERQ